MLTPPWTIPQTADRAAGPHRLEKVFCPVPDQDHDIFDLPRIDRVSGALVVVRPEQYVALTLPLDGCGELNEVFARSTNPA